MTQVGVAGWDTFTTDEERWRYIQRVAEEHDSVITKTDGTIVNARAAINLIAGSGITLTGADNPTANQVDVTIVAASGSLPADPLNVAHGGLGRSTLTNHAVLVGNTTSAVSMIAPGTDGQIFTLVSGAPAWGDIDCGGAG